MARLSIKIQCGCGQKYAFEVEPVNGQVPAPVACPVCGADGTAAANAAIAQSLAAQPATAAPTQGSLHVAAAPVRAAARPRVTQLPGQIDRSQVEHEARAKMLWGDPPHEVTKYLMIQGFSYEEAAELVQAMYKERLATIRGRGITKIVVGILLIFVPIITWFTLPVDSYFWMRIFVGAVAVGIGGLGLLINGIWMLAAPKREEGDAAGQ
jgi:hypothetical protein